MRFIRLLLLLGIILLTMQFCSNPEGPEVCTEEFVTLDVTVLNPEGQPADSVDITVRSRETGNIFAVCEQAPCDHTKPGNYIIMHDSLIDQLSEEGESVLVKGTKGEMQFEEEFSFRGGYCHVAKLAGPDTVSLSSN